MDIVLIFKLKNLIVFLSTKEESFLLVINQKAFYNVCLFFRDESKTF